tara:strand:- start:522 stop:2276 length:1755 start_codon:yes stop_codon:yes gene_type:complete
MLQIISGKFFKDGSRRQNLVRGSLYSNMRPPWHCERIETVAGTLLPSTDLRGLHTLCYEVVEQYEGAKEAGIIASVGADPFLKDFASIVSLALNVICTPDPDLLRRLIGDQPLSPNSISPPRKYVGRVFEAEVNVSDVELDEFKEFVRQLIGLKRNHYLAAIGAIRTYATGLHRIGDDVDLAYTLLVASIESLARGFDGVAPKWEDYDDRKRSAVDDALNGTSQIVKKRVQEALLKYEHIGLARRFRSFALENLAPSYFREEAFGQVRPVGKADLIEAVSQAYAIRSRYVHTLTPVPKQISHVWDLGDTANYEGSLVLTLHGLTRLARHLILAFVCNSPKIEKEDYQYQDDFPNVVTVEMAPQYWVWKHEGFQSSGARRKLGGFFELVVPIQQSLPHAALTDIRDLLRKYERLMPRAIASHRLPMVALYALFHLLVREEDRLPDSARLVERYEDLLQFPSLEGLGLRFALARDVEWPAAAVAALYQGYYKQKYKKNGLKLPTLYEAAFALALAEAYRKEGDLPNATETLVSGIDNQPKIGAIQTALAALNASDRAPISWQALLLPQLKIEPDESNGTVSVTLES